VHVCARPCVVVGRVDVRQQPTVGIERLQLVRPDLADDETVQGVADAERAAVDPSLEMCGTPAGIARAEWMETAAVPGDCRLDALAARGEVPQEGRRQITTTCSVGASISAV
jgi:hypothetical protein